MSEDTAARVVPLYPGGPELYVPPGWTNAQEGELLAKLRARLVDSPAPQERPGA